jgi:hypothetical protein
LAQALKKRAAALQRALGDFNKEAKKLKRPLLSMDDLLGYSFIADVDILRESRDDIRSQQWTVPAVRQGVMMWLKMERAKEEMVRVQVEAKRMEIWITDSSTRRKQVIMELEKEDPHLASELLAAHNLQCEHDGQTLMVLTRLRGQILNWQHGGDWLASTPVVMSSDNGNGSDIGGDVAENGTELEDVEGCEDVGDDENTEQLDLFTSFVIDEPYLQ